MSCPATAPLESRGSAPSSPFFPPLPLTFREPENILLAVEL